MRKQKGFYVMSSLGGDFFAEAENAIGYVAFLSEMGYDSVYYTAWMEGGVLRLGGMISEDEVEGLIGRRI